jgi:hypothetical protein
MLGQSYEKYIKKMITIEIVHCKKILRGAYFPCFHEVKARKNIMLRQSVITGSAHPASFEAAAPVYALNYGVDTGKGRLTD